MRGCFECEADHHLARENDTEIIRHEISREVSGDRRPRLVDVMRAVSQRFDAVDRRFDRPRLEAERSLAAYGERLQHEVDLRAVTRDVEETAVSALRPSTIALWIRPSRAARS